MISLASSSADLVGWWLAGSSRRSGHPEAQGGLRALVPGGARETGELDGRRSVARPPDAPCAPRAIAPPPMRSVLAPGLVASGLRTPGGFNGLTFTGVGRLLLGFLGLPLPLAADGDANVADGGAAGADGGAATADGGAAAADGGATVADGGAAAADGGAAAADGGVAAADGGAAPAGGGAAAASNSHCSCCSRCSRFSRRCMSRRCVSMFTLAILARSNLFLLGERNGLSGSSPRLCE